MLSTTSKKLLSFSISFCCLLVPSMSFAQENPPEVITYIGKQAPLGKGTVTLLTLSLYDVTIWSKAKTWSWNTPFVLQLRYAKSFSKEDIVDASINEMNKIQPLSEATANHYRKTLNDIFLNVKKNDTISAVFLPKKELLFFYNGKRIGSITDIKLARAFMDIWLSDKSRDPQLRNQILHLGAN